MVAARPRRKHPPLKAALGTALLLTAALSVFGGALNSRPASANAEDPENGRHLYTFYGCIECHGPDAEGDFGPKITGLTVSVEEFLTQLRTPREEMDAYPSDFLSDEQARDVYSFLKTLQ